MTPESLIYVYATEMVARYYSLVDLSNKSVLTIIGSGDQILNAYFFGAKDVTGFDINNRSVFFVDLKIQALCSLTYEEFLSFFGTNFKDGSLDEETYLRLRDKLSSDTQSFFDKAYKEAEGGRLMKSGYFRERSFMEADARDINAYLKDEDSYMKLREVMQTARPEFITGNIKDIADNLPKEGYDVINMSNVLNYFVGKKEERVADMLDLLKILSNSIREGGVLFFYSYSSLIYGDGTEPPASREETVEKIKDLDIFDIEMKTFKGTREDGIDRITILKKR